MILVSFIECSCDKAGTTDNICNDDGECLCKQNIAGDSCDQCASGFFEFPSCTGTF